MCTNLHIQQDTPFKNIFSAVVTVDSGCYCLLFCDSTGFASVSFFMAVVSLAAVGCPTSLVCDAFAAVVLSVVVCLLVNVCRGCSVVTA